MNWIGKLITEHAGLKLLSLALALALWAAVGSDPVTEASFRVPVEFIGVPPHLELLTQQPSVQIRARGPSHAVRQAAPGDFIVRLNAGAITAPGQTTFPLDVRKVVSPAALQIIELIPNEVQVNFETIVSKDVPIAPQFSGTPPAGYRLKEYTVEPQQTRITGPASHVQRISAAPTDPVDLTHIAGQMTSDTDIFIRDPLIRMANPGTVRVTVVTEKEAAAGAGYPSRKHR